VPPVAHDRHAVDEHVAHAGRQLVRARVRRAVDDGRRVEHDHVGAHPLAEEPAVGDREPRRDGGRHLAHRVLQRQHARVAHVAPEHAREGAVRPRVGEPPRRVGVEAAGVAADLDPRLAQLQRDVLLGHQEEHRAEPGVLREREVEDGVDPAHAARPRDLCERPAVERPERGGPEPRDRHPLGRGEQAQVLPRRARRRPLEHLGGDPRAHRRVAQVGEEPVVGRGPRRDAGGEGGAAGRVGVHAGLDVLAGAPRRVDLGDGLRRLAPVPPAGGLEVVHLDRHPAAAPDLDRLVERLEEPVGLGAHVGDVDAAVRRHRPGQLVDEVAVRAVDLDRVEAEPARVGRGAPGLVVRRVPPTSPIAVEYRLTPLARGLLPLLRALYAWTVDRLAVIAKALGEFDGAHGAAERAP
jgi:hypothetical protein